jgi:23S rRNA (uridine2552-2'-O)-methyltransferase
VKKRSSSSKAWLREHHSDVYVNQARREGYRSRAAYKLLEIDRKDRLLRPGMTVVDLGAAPGGWSQVAAERVGRKGRVIALDRLDMPPLPGVEFIRGDILDDDYLAFVRERLGDGLADLVISDMAPNISGVDAVDQPRSIYLAELALDLAGHVLAPGGDLLVKVFQGAGSEAYMAELRSRFKKIAVRKPQSSRARSREIYLLARGFRGPGAEVG